MKNAHSFVTRLQKRPRVLDMVLTERLPTYVHAPCHVHVEWSLEPQDTLEILSINITADITVDCQRCGHHFVQHFEHKNKIALCKHIRQFESMIADQDCLLIDELPEKLEEIITDEIHLYLNARHSEDICKNL